MAARSPRRRYNLRERQEAVARVRAGVARNEVAAALGLCPETVSRWCKDLRNRRRVGRGSVGSQISLDFPFEIRPEHLP